MTSRMVPTLTAADAALGVEHNLGVGARVLARARGGTYGRLHCEERHDLEQVVLDDVADDAVLVEVAAAALRAEVLAEDDLHVADVLPAPQRLEHQIREAQHLQPQPCAARPLETKNPDCSTSVAPTRCSRLTVPACAIRVACG